MFLAFLPSLWWMLSVFSIPWLAAATLQSTSIVTWSFPCVSVFIFSHGLLLKMPVIGFRTHTNPVRPHFNLNTSAKTLFPNEVTFHRYRRLATCVEHILGNTVPPAKPYYGICVLPCEYLSFQMFVDLN